MRFVVQAGACFGGGARNQPSQRFRLFRHAVFSRTHRPIFCVKLFIFVSYSFLKLNFRLGQEDGKDKKSPRFVKLPEKKFKQVCAGESFTIALGGSLSVSNPLQSFAFAQSGPFLGFCRVWHCLLIRIRKGMGERERFVCERI